MNVEAGQASSSESNSSGVHISEEQAKEEASNLLAQISSPSNLGGGEAAGSVQNPQTESTAPQVSSPLGKSIKSILVGSSPPFELKPDATGFIASPIIFLDFDAIQFHNHLVKKLPALKNDIVVVAVSRS